LMLVRADGGAWNTSHQIRPLLRACEQAGISPPISFHILRHTYASLLVMAGAPLQVVAHNLGHADTRMTERHYAHLASSYIADTIRALSPRLGVVEPTNVVQFGGGRTPGLT
jgi:site-specific recombinase XerD